MKIHKGFIAILVGVMLIFSTYRAWAAANTVTSGTGTASIITTDTVFKVTYRPVSKSGVVLFIKYVQDEHNTGVTLTFDTINRSLSATDLYRYPVLSGTTLSAYTMTLTATGNYRIPLPLISSETTIVANITFAVTDHLSTVVANFIEP